MTGAPGREAVAVSSSNASLQVGANTPSLSGNENFPDHPHQNSAFACNAAIRLAIAIEHAATPDQLDDLGRQLYRLNVAGEIGDHEVSFLDEALRRRRGVHPRQTGGVPGLSRMWIRTPKRTVSPDRQKAIRRRRELGGSGAFPGRIAGLFPTAQQAVLAIVAYEVKAKGSCALTVQEIADRAGVCRSTVHNALAEAKTQGLIKVQARRLSPVKNLANIVTIISPEWLAWLDRGGRARSARQQSLAAPAVFRWGPNARTWGPQIHQQKGAADEEWADNCHAPSQERPKRGSQAYWGFRYPGRKADHL